MRILVVEDEPDLASAIATSLRREGYAVDVAHDGSSAAERVDLNEYDLVCLDLNLPDADGLDVCRHVVASATAEVTAPRLIMLTARGSVEDRVRGLDAGADDYLVKPFAFAELVARLRALARRGSIERPNVLSCGDVSLDPATRRISVGTASVTLVGREFALLEYFLHHQDEVLSRSRIIDEVWDWAFEGTPRIIDVYVSALRGHLGGGARTPRIETIRGVGYVLRVPVATDIAPPTGTG